MKHSPNTKCATCGKAIYRYPCELRDFDRFYCSNSCRLSPKDTMKEFRTFIMDNYGFMPTKSIAKKLDVCPATIRNHVRKWSKEESLNA